MVKEKAKAGPERAVRLEKAQDACVKGFMVFGSLGVMMPFVNGCCFGETRRQQNAYLS